MTDSDTETRTPPQAEIPNIRRLVNSRHVRRLLARLIEQTWAGKIDPRTANCITYQLSTVARVINDEAVLALGKRLAALEQRAGDLPSINNGGSRLNA